MKKLAALLLAVSVFSIACKKDDTPGDDNPAAIGGSYTIEGKTFAADYAYWTGRDGLVITNKPQAPEYVENSVQIAVDSLYFSDTFTYMNRNDLSYDIKKNFFGSYVRYNTSGIYGQGVEITGLTAGTLNVTREKELFNIKFNITVAGKVIQGTYVGTVEGKKFE